MKIKVLFVSLLSMLRSEKFIKYAIPRESNMVILH